MKIFCALIVTFLGLFYIFFNDSFFSKKQSYFCKKSFLQDKLDTATIGLVDVVEQFSLGSNYCSQEDLQDIEKQVKMLFERAQENKEQHTRLYTFIAISHTFNNKLDDSENYMYWGLLCLEIDPFFLQKMSIEDIQSLEKIANKKLVNLYTSQKLKVEKIIPGCYVSCVQIGAEKLSSRVN